MLQKKLVAIGLFGMSQAGVKRSATIKLMIPGNRMISHFGTPLVALFIEFQQDIDLFVYIPVAVPLIGSFPAFRQKLCRGMVGVCYQYRPRLNIGMRVVDSGVIQKVSSHQSSIPTDRKSTRLNSSHVAISYAVFSLQKKRSGFTWLLF